MSDRNAIARHAVMHCLVVVALAAMTPALAAGEPGSLIGRRVRLATIPAPADSAGTNPARVLRESADRVTLVGAWGEDPTTRTKTSWGLVGKVVPSADDRYLTLICSGGSGPGRVIVRREDITSMEVYRRHSRGRNALIGAGIGAGIATVIGLVSGDDPPGSFIQFSGGEKAVFLSIVMVPLGGLLGLAIPPGERWEPVSSNRVGLSLAPLHGTGAAVALRLGF